MRSCFKFPLLLFLLVVSPSLQNLQDISLPVLEVQFVCDHDYRPPASNTSGYFLEQYKDLYDNLIRYKGIITEISTLHHVERFSVMSDISPTKWYYSDCDMKSPQLLTSLKVKGRGTSIDSQIDSELSFTGLDRFTEANIKDFFSQHVCSNMTEFRAYVDPPKTKRHHSSFYYSTSSSPKQSMTFDHIEHSLLLLCGDENLVYYEDGTPDAGFLFFGFFVGFIMVFMIGTELKRYDNRPHPLGDRGRAAYDGVPAGGQEVEMV